MSRTVLSRTFSLHTYNSENTQSVILCVVLCVRENWSAGPVTARFKEMVCCRSYDFPSLVSVLCFQVEASRQADHSSRGVLPIACICLSCSVIRSKNYRLHLQCLGRKRSD